MNYSDEINVEDEIIEEQIEEPLEVKVSSKKDKLKIGGFKPHGKIIGFRKRNVIAWIERNELARAKSKK